MKLRSILLCSCVASAAMFTAFCVIHIPSVTHDFGEYYKFARAIIEGKSLAPMYDYAYFNAPENAFGITAPGMPNNLPTNALALVAIARLDPMGARIVWGVVSVLCLAIAIQILFKVFFIDWKSTLGLCILTLIFVFRPAYSNVNWGQLYFVLLLLFTISLRGVQKKQPLLIAVPIALALVLKGYGVVPLLWLMSTRRRKEAGMVVALTCLIIILCLPWIGADAWSAYYHTVFVRLGRLPTDSILNYQTVNGFVRRCLHYDALLNPNPVADISDDVLFPIVLLINASIIILLFKKLRDYNVEDIYAYSVMVAAGVVTAPIAMGYHYLLFLPLIVACIRASIGNPRTELMYHQRPVNVLAAIGLIAMPFGRDWLRHASLPLALFGYVQLLGALVLLFSAPRLLGSKQRETRVSHE